jgi:hypothetical protein
VICLPETKAEINVKNKKKYQIQTDTTVEWKIILSPGTYKQRIKGMII